MRSLFLDPDLAEQVFEAISPGGIRITLIVTVSRVVASCHEGDYPPGRVQSGGIVVPWMTPLTELGSAAPPPQAALVLKSPILFSPR